MGNETKQQCKHEPGGYWDENDPLCARPSEGGLNAPYSKCVHCGALIKEVDNVFVEI